MAQVTIYLPDDLEALIKKKAKQSHKSVSSFLAELAQRSVRPTSWPTGFADLYGTWEGELAEPDDPPPTERGAF